MKIPVLVDLKLSWPFWASLVLIAVAAGTYGVGIGLFCVLLLFIACVIHVMVHP